MPAPSHSPEFARLDAATGGALSAPTAAERAARIREWLLGDPSAADLQEVQRELSQRDKGAARPVRDRLDELRRAKAQETLGTEWAERAQALLAQPRLNIADALAWQRDAAKAGAPLAREPLAALKDALGTRTRAVEELQHRAQVQRESALLLAQRIELLSTKSLAEAQAAAETLAADEPAWQAEAQAMLADAQWPSVEHRHAAALESSRGQLHVVWDAFQAALSQAQVAAADPAQPLPSVPVWAEEIRQRRAGPVAEAPARREAPDPQRKAQAVAELSAALEKLEAEISQGHGKASAGAATALREALRDHGAAAGSGLERRAQAALAAAGELADWQRWRTDQLRQELIARAEALFEPAAPAAEGEAPAEPKPRLGGRKMQDAVRELREQWKQADQGGPPNHGMWRRFDQACNRAHKVVEDWLEKVRAQSAQARAERLSLIEEVRTWAAENRQARDGDWRGFGRVLHGFSERWRAGGHLGEKAFAEIQPAWKEVIHLAAQPLEDEQKRSTEVRQAMVQEAAELAHSPAMRLDAVRGLQQRWQSEAQRVPLDRRHEQRLWDAFRKPIDEAFERRSQQREQALAAMSATDRAVLDASRALEEATASGDASKIRAAMAQLDAAGRAVAPQPAAPVPAVPAPPAPPATEAPEAPAEAPPEPVAAKAPAPPKPVVARRGDDRPGAKRAEPPSAPGRGFQGDRRGGRGGDRDRSDRPGSFRDARGGNGRPEEARGPRLGDAAFRAQRDAFERAEASLRRLAGQAHGESLERLMGAWEARTADSVPSTGDLGKAVTPAIRSGWTRALANPAAADEAAATALLRLEMAADVPTPAEHLNARRALQLQLLTRRNDAGPSQTWGADAAAVFATAHEPAAARRLQAALKRLLRP